MRTPAVILVLLAVAACGGAVSEDGASPCGNALLDRIHCGSCDVVCPPVATCAEGVCVCGHPDQGLCFDECVDIVANDAHCGACGNECGSGESCLEGVCVCRPGRDRCGDNCVDLQGHALHCGACDTPCDEGARCQGGACTCPEGRESCGGVCTDYTDDNDNCGACGNVCPLFTDCTNGACRCNDGFGTLCDGACIDTRTDEDNCGACGQTCVVGARCLGGDCSCRGDDPATCDERCVDLEADAFHCGACGQACGPGQDCLAGQCRCQGLLSECEDGCADLGTNADHCGTCGNPCAPEEVCCGGECFADACPDRPLDVACADDLGDLPFFVPPETGGWIFSAWVPDGTIDLRQIRTPTEAFNLASGDYAFARRGTAFLDTVHPVLIPMTPEFSALVQPGNHTAAFRGSGPPCYAVASTSGRGTRLHVRVILAGAPGLNAGNAAADPRWRQALLVANRRLGQAGFSLEVVTYEDAAPEIATRYAVIREFDEILDLVSTSQWPGLTPESRLVLNVYVIRVFAVPAGGEVLGVSAGIPGAAGVHGTRASGVVVSIRDDATLLGNVIAHEAGHFLGLFHTTEVFGRESDPLEDTPVCTEEGWRDPRTCPGFDNLMFPYAQSGEVSLTADQSAVLRANPLVR